MNMERCKAPDPRPSTPDPIAQLEAMVRKGWMIGVSDTAPDGDILIEIVPESNDDGDVMWGCAPTLAAAIDALARKVGGGE